MLAPALSRLREDPRERTILVGYTERLAPLIEAGLADGVVSLDRWLTDGESILIEKIGSDSIRAKQGERAPISDVRIDSFYPTLPKGVSQNRIEVKVHPPLPEQAAGIPVAVYLAQALGVQLTLSPNSPLENLCADRAPKDSSTLWIHPGAGSSEKRWPLAAFLEVASRWEKRTRSEIRFLLGEADLELEAPILEAGFRIELPPTLLDMARRFSKADSFLGNDSGPTHLAALMGLRTVAIFITTDPGIWRPWGPNSLALGDTRTGGCLQPVDILARFPHFVASGI